jgi:carboxymethylenebutenolidase
LTDAIQAETVTITAHGGDEIEAYAARCLDPTPRGGVVVIHHMPGYDRATKEITRTFATYGYNAVCPNLFHRFAPGARPGDAAAAARDAGGVPDDQAMGDIAGGAAYLRGLPNANGKVGVIGYCSGGRQAFLAACLAPVDAAVDCYGGGVVVGPDATTPQRPVPPIDLVPKMNVPLLGLFGDQDRNPSPEHVARMEQDLSAAGKDFEFHTYEGANHGFFSVDFPSYNQDAVRDGWKQIWAFFGRHLV